MTVLSPIRSSLFRIHHHQYRLLIHQQQQHQQRFTRQRSFSSHAPLHARNRIYPVRIRNESELHTLILSSASSRIPLLTLWMTTWDAHSDTISSLIKTLLETEGVGEEQGSVSYVEVEMDSPDLGGVSAGIAQRYLITAIPTLLAFDRQEPQVETKVSRVEDLKSEEFLRSWIEREAARHGKGGAGGRLGGLFGR